MTVWYKAFSELHIAIRLRKLLVAMQVLHSMGVVHVVADKECAV